MCGNYCVGMNINRPNNGCNGAILQPWGGNEKVAILAPIESGGELPLILLVPEGHTWRDMLGEHASRFFLVGTLGDVLKSANEVAERRAQQKGNNDE